MDRVPHEPVEGAPRLGDVVIGRIEGNGPRVLLIGHMDTVFDQGAAAERPFRIDGDRAFGPGVTDMKAGLLAGLHAIAALHAAGERPALTFVANPDEEIGSPFSSAFIRELAPAHDAVLVLECARANGDIVSARKGVADYHVSLTGRAAHAGVEPEKGRSAILAAAHLVLALHDLNGRWPSVTVNAGVIAGGRARTWWQSAASCRSTSAPPPGRRSTRPPPRSSALPPPRGRRRPQRAASHGRSPADGEGAGSTRLVEQAVAIAAELGFELRDAATGGASDANTTAALGVPTIDGLGPVGGDDHSVDEWLDVGSIVPRTTLLAALIGRITGA